ncbi:MAG: hypothetical protein ABIJ00_14945 [Candidatus Eisenbacteria bacterium]
MRVKMRLYLKPHTGYNQQNPLSNARIAGIIILSPGGISSPLETGGREP